MRAARIVWIAALTLASAPQSVEAFFDRQRLESGSGGPVVLLDVIDPSFGAPASACIGAWCGHMTYSYPAYAPSRILWPVPRYRSLPARRIPPYYPYRRRHR